MPPRNAQLASPTLWHLLQVSDALDLELAQALADSNPVIAWEPLRSYAPWLTPSGAEAERRVPGHTLRVRKLPLLRGFSRAPISWFARTGPSIVRRLKRQSEDPARSPLICTTPYFASVAERWPGPVVYWLTDLIAHYEGADRRQVEALDLRMCRAATLVCPNSNRLAEYLTESAGCDPARIQIVPNATRASNLLPHPAHFPADLPSEVAGIPRPVAGVIGNQAGNLDWRLIEQTMLRTPWLNWVFVGPTTMPIDDPELAAARRAVMDHPRTHFVGKKPYAELAAWARSFDVAVLPYRRCEPTWSGSSTRFYEHLAACRPMIATRGFEELLHKTPLLELVDTSVEAVEALERLRTANFNDGLQSQRWKASLAGTWQARARTMQRALAERVRSPQHTPWMESYLPTGTDARL